jgi:hypothetical protein
MSLSEQYHASSYLELYDEHRRHGVRLATTDKLMGNDMKTKAEKITWHAREMLKLTHCLPYEHLQTANNCGSAFCSFSKKSCLFRCIDRIEDDSIRFKCLLQNYIFVVRN